LSQTTQSIDGRLLGVFGTDAELKQAFETSVAKRSEAEGTIVYHRNESGRRFYFLDDASFPERIQGYSRIASLVDFGYFVLPSSGNLSAADGELAVLIDSFGLTGAIESIETPFSPEAVSKLFSGLSLGGFPLDSRPKASSVIDLERIPPRMSSPNSGALVYVDRAFSVKGVGTVVLGFTLAGKISVHDKLRLLPGPEGLSAEVKGIQVNDVDYESVGRGLRVGLSLKGIDARDLQKTPWLDDGSTTLSSALKIVLTKSRFYKQELAGRDLHVQLPGEMVPAKILDTTDGMSTLSLSSPVPVWNGMRAVIIDLNARPPRVAGGGDVVL
jgi:selenocysteine-specific translation elongation factor